MSYSNHHGMQVALLYHHACCVLSLLAVMCLSIRGGLVVGSILKRLCFRALRPMHVTKLPVTREIRKLYISRLLMVVPKRSYVSICAPGVFDDRSTCVLPAPYFGCSEWFISGPWPSKAIFSQAQHPPSLPPTQLTNQPQPHPTPHSSPPPYVVDT